MLSITDIRQNLAGAWALFRADANGMSLLDTTFRGFWLSFMAIALLAPVYGLYLAGEQRLMATVDEPLDVTFGTYLSVRTLTFIVDWVAFPILMILLVGLIDRRSRYVPFVVAYNWGGVIIELIVALPTVLFAAGMMPLGLLYVLTLIAMAVALRYLYIIARVALFADRTTAVGLVVADFALSLVLAEAFSRMFGF
ncbi:MAG: hypothetical protein AAGD23_01195 [Pseudomonadota bacterium]